MKREKKICQLVGFFGQHNLGDDLLFVEAINNIPIDYDIYTVDEIINEYDKRRIFSFSSKIKSIFQKKDLVIMAGGGLFPSTTYKFRSLLSSKIFCFQSKLKVMEGVGIVPKLAFPDKIWFKIFVNSFNYVSVRDNVSLDYLKNIGIRSVVNCHDLYFGHNIYERIDAKRKGGIICLATPFSDNELRNERIRSRYDFLLKQIQNLCIRIKQKYGKLTFLPFCLGSDEKIIKDVMKDSNLSDSEVLTYGKDFKIEEIDEIFSQYRIGLCMRFHSIVLAIRNLVPCIGICYDHKSWQLLEESNLDFIGLKYGIRIGQFWNKEFDIDDNELEMIYNRVVTDNDIIVKNMRMARELYYKDVQNNYKEIFKLL